MARRPAGRPDPNMVKIADLNQPASGLRDRRRREASASAALRAPAATIQEGARRSSTSELSRCPSRSGGLQRPLRRLRVPAKRGLGPWLWTTAGAGEGAGVKTASGCVQPVAVFNLKTEGAGLEQARERREGGLSQHGPAGRRDGRAAGGGVLNGAAAARLPALTPIRQ
jgi:hypothetical protein